MLILKMAWRNIWRQRRRTLITMLTMAICVAVAIPTFGLAEGITREMVNGVTRSHLGHIQIHHREFPMDENPRHSFAYHDVVQKLETIEGIEAAAPRIYTGALLSSRKRFKATLAPLPAPGGSCDIHVTENLASTHHLPVGAAIYPDPPLPSGECVNFTLTAITKEATPMVRVSPGTLRHFISTALEEPPDEDLDALKPLGANSHPQHKPSGARASSWTFFHIVQLPMSVAMVDPRYERRVTAVATRLMSGRYLTESPRKGDRKQILIGKRAAQKLNVAVGQPVGLDLFTRDGLVMDENFVVAGIFSMGVPELEERLLYIHINTGWEERFSGTKSTTERMVNEVAIALKDPASVDTIASRLKSAMGKPLLVRTWKEIKPSMSRVIRLQEGLVTMILVIILAVAVIGTTNTMMMSVLERTYEFGVLKAIGVKPLQVGSIILIESLSIIVLSLVLGLAMGIPLCLYLATSGIDLSIFLSEGFTLQGVLLNPVWRPMLTLNAIVVPCTILSLATLMGALMPALRAAKLSPIRELREE